LQGLAKLPNSINPIKLNLMGKLQLLIILFMSGHILSSEWKMTHEAPGATFFLDMDSIEVRKNANQRTFKTVGDFDTPQDNGDGTYSRSLGMMNLADCKNKRFKILSYANYRTKRSPKVLSDTLGYGKWPDPSWIDFDIYYKKLINNVCASAKKYPITRPKWKKIEKSGPAEVYIAQRSMLKKQGLIQTVFSYKEDDKYLAIQADTQINCDEGSHDIKKLKYYLSKLPKGFYTDIYTGDFLRKDFEEVFDSFVQKHCLSDYSFKAE